MADTLAGALLPEPQAPLVRRRMTALPTVWAAMCKHRLDQIPWEKISYGIIAEGSGRCLPAEIPELACYTSVARFLSTIK